MGASGRNGGWVNGWEDLLPTLLARFGDEDARWLVDRSVEACPGIERTVRESDIDCDLVLDGGLEIALSAAQMARHEEDAAERERHGTADLVIPLDAQQAREACGSPARARRRRAQDGRRRPAGAARAGAPPRRRRARRPDLRGQPDDASARGSPAVVETPSGCVTAGKVVLAAGAWSAQIAELRRTVFVMPAHIVATAPSAEVLDEMGWRRGMPFADGRTAVHYGQRTADDRLVFGRGGGRLGFAGRVIPTHFHDHPNAASIVEDLHELFPASGKLTVEWRWGGPVERTQHGSPWVGTLGKAGNIHYGIGYGGNGVAPSNLIGRTLASVALDRDDDFARSPLVSDPPSYLPPEPFRFVAARSMRSAIERYEILEDEGRKPDPVSNLLRRGLGLKVPKGIEVSKVLRRNDE